MKIDLFRMSFLLSTVVGIAGALLKITHLMHAGFFFIISLLLTLLYVFIGIIEVHQSARSFTSKFFWSLAFIFFSFFTAIFWLMNGRNGRPITI